MSLRNTDGKSCISAKGAIMTVDGGATPLPFDGNASEACVTPPHTLQMTTAENVFERHGVNLDMVARPSGRDP